jgi:hypothetical protein
VAGSEHHHLLLYDYVEDMVERRHPHREAHLARVAAERERGRIVMGGALGDPPTGAAIVFKSLEPDAIEEFVCGDPYVKAGLVTSWRVEFWNLI